MNLKKRTMIAAAMMISAAALPLTAQDAPAAAEKPAAPAVNSADDVFGFLPDVVVEYGDKKVTKQQFITEISTKVSPEDWKAIPPAQVKSILKSMAEGLMTQEVLLTLAEKEGIKPSPELAKAMIDQMMNQLPNDNREAFKNALTQMGKTIDQYKDEVAADPMAQKGAAINKWMEGIKGKLENQVSDADIEKFYRENQEAFKTDMAESSHILISVPEVDENGKPFSKEEMKAKDEEAKKKAEDILAKLKQGAKFEELAKAESACPSGQGGGSLGKNQRGAMVPEFDKALFALEKKGDLSDVVKTQFGYHIIRLDADRQGEGYTPLAEVKDELKDYLLSEKVNNEAKKLLEEEKEKLKAKILGFDDVPSITPMSF